MEDLNKDCPTAVLIDISSPSCSYLSDLKEKIGIKSDADTFSKNSVDHSPPLVKVNNQSPEDRLLWKAPSPKSMSHINKEALKVIDNLNSSFIFDDDTPLTDEIIPIPMSFDVDFESSVEVENVAVEKCENKLMNLSVSVQTQTDVQNSKQIEEVLHDCIRSSDPDPASKSLDPIIEASSSIKTPEKSSEDGSAEIFSSSEMHSESGLDDVFIVQQIASEDKENIQCSRENILSDEMVDDKTPRKIFFTTKLEFRGSLRNVSNITHEITNSPNQNMTTPQRGVKVFHSSSAKPQIKKMVGSQITPKVIPRTNLFQSKKEFVSNLKKEILNVKNVSTKPDSLCKSSSSDLKHSFSNLKTPSKRYSVSSTPAIKLPLTPALHGSKNSIQRSTPHSTDKSRLSLSKSWQPPASASKFLKSSGIKQQNYMAVAASANFAEINSRKSASLNTPIPRRQSFSQSMSATSFRALKRESLATADKSRLQKKLNFPSPITTAKDRKSVHLSVPSVSK